VYILSTIVVVGVSASRVALRAHYYWDILGGVLYGFIIGGLAYYARLHCNTRPPVEPLAFLVLPSIILGFYNVFIRGVELALPLVSLVLVSRFLHLSSRLVLLSVELLVVFGEGFLHLLYLVLYYCVSTLLREPLVFS
jgi:hypothetical protein